LDTVTLIGLAAVRLVSRLKDSCSLLDKVQSVRDQRNRMSLQLHPVKPNTSLLSTPQRKVSGYQMFLHNCLVKKLLLFSLSELTTKVPSIRQPAHPLTTAISTSIFVTTMFEKPYETNIFKWSTVVAKCKWRTSSPNHYSVWPMSVSVKWWVCRSLSTDTIQVEGACLKSRPSWSAEVLELSILSMLTPITVRSGRNGPQSPEELYSFSPFWQGPIPDVPPARLWTPNLLFSRGSPNHCPR